MAIKLGKCPKILIFLIIIFTGIDLKSLDQKSDVWMTIFVHGIIKTPWTLKDLFKITHNDVLGSTYAYATQYLRTSEHYSMIQPMQGLGLVKIDTSCKNASSAIASIYDYEFGPDTKNYYYTFGWTGLLSRKHRELEGKDFFYSLKDEINKLHDQNIFPKIRIVNFSHGGNVTLNMARLVPYHNLPFVVDELILLGSPVQRETDYLINHPVFKKVYNFYSEGDIAQAADFLSTRYGHSKRKFKSRRDFPIENKLVQIKIHTTKVTCKNNKVVRKRACDPSHMELWTFGWVPRIYRASFPLAPLPVAAFVPSIIKSIESIDKNLSRDLSVNLVPKLEKIIVKDNCTKCKYNTEFSNLEFEDLKNIALKFKSNYSCKERLQLMRDALTYAHHEKMSKK